MNNIASSENNTEVNTVIAVVKSSDKKCAQKLLDRIESFTHISNIEQFKIYLTQIIDYDPKIKYTDPSLYCSYEYDGRCGYFKASDTWTLSEYITATVCQVRFYYSDVLGKHSELDFTVDKVDYQYIGDIESESDDEDRYKLSLEYERSPYSCDIFENVLEHMRKYMESLEPLLLDNFEDERHSLLIEHAEKYLKSLILTTNPNIEVISPDSYCDFSLPLSLYLVNLLQNPDVVVFPKSDSYSFSCCRENVRWKDVKIKPIPDTDYYFKIKTSIDNPELEAKIKSVLSQYEPLSPIDFFNMHFETVKQQCMAIL
jgi:hypothetical protein